jgi:hypothetical protein
MLTSFQCHPTGFYAVNLTVSSDRGMKETNGIGTIAPGDDGLAASLGQ